MEAREFEKITEKVLTRISETLISKAKEYASEDRLRNFKVAAKILNCTPEKVLLFWVTKHFEALTSFVSDLDHSKVIPMDRWDEKTYDIMAYMVLMNALNIERNRNEEVENSSNDVDSFCGNHPCTCGDCSALKCYH